MASSVRESFLKLFEDLYDPLVDENGTIDAIRQNGLDRYKGSAYVTQHAEDRAAIQASMGRFRVLAAQMSDFLKTQPDGDFVEQRNKFAVLKEKTETHIALSQKTKECFDAVFKQKTEQFAALDPHELTDYEKRYIKEAIILNLNEFPAIAAQMYLKLLNVDVLATTNADIDRCIADIREQPDANDHNVLELCNYLKGFRIDDVSERKEQKHR